MDSLVQFVWNRRQGGRPPREASDWACALLEQGVESEAILLLAANPQLDSQEQQQLLAQSLVDLGRARLLDKDLLADDYERGLVEDYYAGRLDGGTLIQQGVELYLETHFPEKRLFWMMISDDADHHGGQGICLRYPFNARPFDEVLAEALAENGFPRPAQGA
jgi:hypothetical protein